MEVQAIVETATYADDSFYMYKTLTAEKQPEKLRLWMLFFFAEQHVARPRKSWTVHWRVESFDVLCIKRKYDEVQAGEWV